MGNKKGFSLVEALVSIALFAVVAAAVGSLLATSFLAEGWNANHAAAVSLGQQELENLRSLDYADIQGGVTAYQRRGRTFTVTTAVRNDQPVANMKEITVTVSWEDAQQNRSYAAQTIYTNVQR